MRVLVITSLILVLLLIALAAYLRLSHSGIGCTPWPACYGNIGPEREAAALHERLIEDATSAKSWATPLHRIVATVLGLLILLLNILALRKKRDLGKAFTLLCLTAFLAVLGVKSGGLRSPAIVMGNLLGGFAMLAVLGRMLFRKGGTAGGRSAMKTVSLAAMIMLGLQIAIGGLTSANFAASACRTLPDCHGSWLPGRDLMTALDLTRRHTVGDGGFVQGGPERADIHKLHRLSALATLVLIFAAGVAAIRAGHDLRIVGSLLMLLVSVEFSVGVTAVLSGLPIALAVAHNVLAALLLLCLLKLHAEAHDAPG